MNGCRRETSERFVADLLNEVEEAMFVEHLDACPRCRQWLEEEAGGESAVKSARELLVYSCESNQRKDSQHGLPRGFVPHHSESALPEVSRASLTFLAPSDDPAMIGRIGPYEVNAVLGRGGMGIVLKGFDRALNRNVAIKVLDPSAATVGAARERFAREARAMAAISHQHVVPIYAVDEHAGLPYFVMEYVAGGTLERRLKTEGPCDVLSIVRIGLQAAEALAAAHHQGLVHRDIKPANILLDKGTDRIRVADFGLARVANDVSCTRSGFLAGTPQYMSPEQVRAETCDAHSDLFSLGAVMYAMCTAHAPFRADTVYAVLQRIVHDSPRPIREQNPLLPLWLDRFIFRLLAKDKTARFSSADELVGILETELAYLQNRGSAAEPARGWSPEPVQMSSGRWQWPTGWRACSIAALILLGLGLWPFLRDGTPRTSLQYAASRVSDELPSVPLWNADGTRETRASADELQASWYREPAGAYADPWLERTTELRRRLAELAAEVARSVELDN